MCDPITAGIATAVGAGLSLYGSMQQASAAKKQQQAIADQNRADQVAQQQGFVARNQAAQTATQAQLAASEETMAARNQAATQMREAQMSAMKRYQDVLNTENQQAELLRQRGDTAAQQLVQATTGDQLQQTQAQREQEQAQLAGGGAPAGPEATDPNGTNAVSTDTANQGALARRTAEAATNIRNYGAKIARADAYGAPTNRVGLAIADTGYGIMPAEAADKLLRGGSGTRLLPTQVAYGGATNLGQAQDTLLQSKGERALEGANLTLGNTEDLANLRQSNAQTLAKNTSLQQQADAQYQAAQGAQLGSLGKVALYGAGYFGGFGSAVPSGWVAGSGAGSNYMTNLATGETQLIPSAFDRFGSTLSGIGNKVSSIF